MTTTRAERLWIYMRREDLRAKDIAREYDVTINRVSEWLNSSGEEIPPNFPWNGHLEPWEEMSIWRRREGWGIREAGRRMGVSHVTLLKRERGDGEWSETYDWWERRRERAAERSA